MEDFVTPKEIQAIELKDFVNQSDEALWEIYGFYAPRVAVRQPGDECNVVLGILEMRNSKHLIDMTKDLAESTKRLAESTRALARKTMWLMVATWGLVIATFILVYFAGKPSGG
jgi:hypothetical protein